MSEIYLLELFGFVEFCNDEMFLSFFGFQFFNMYYENYNLVIVQVDLGYQF